MFSIRARSWARAGFPLLAQTRIYPLSLSSLLSSLLLSSPWKDGQQVGRALKGRESCLVSASCASAPRRWKPLPVRTIGRRLACVCCIVWTSASLLWRHGHPSCSGDVFSFDLAVFTTACVCFSVVGTDRSDPDSGSRLQGIDSPSMI